MPPQRLLKKAVQRFVGNTNPFNEGYAVKFCGLQLGGAFKAFEKY